LSGDARATVSLLLAYLEKESCLSKIINSDPNCSLIAELAIIGIITDCGFDVPETHTAQDSDIAAVYYLFAKLAFFEENFSVLSGFVDKQNERKKEILTIKNSSVYFREENGIALHVFLPESLKLDADMLGQTADILLAEAKSDVKEVWVCMLVTNTSGKSLIKVSGRAHDPQSNMGNKIVQTLGPSMGGGTQRACGGMVSPDHFGFESSRILGNLGNVEVTQYEESFFDELQQQLSFSNQYSSSH
jgi:hypothetical protein